jgi:hypothetical protein
MSNKYATNVFLINAIRKQKYENWGNGVKEKPLLKGNGFSVKRTYPINQAVEEFQRLLQKCCLKHSYHLH